MQKTGWELIVSQIGKCEKMVLGQFAISCDTFTKIICLHLFYVHNMILKTALNSVDNNNCIDLLLI